MSDEQQQQPTETPEQPVAQETPAPTPTPPVGGPVPGADKKMLAGILGILIGAFGIHKFVLGYQKEGLIMLLVTVLTCGFGGMVMGVIGLIEGIMYLTKSDEEFVNTYIANQKTWF
ncbi:MAG: TM2 domain-containing protein [Verrucomicrobiae bacterium]|nr:TM2 domain-containing protein [Verrucomicrobiae bacterium]NNJ86276.1 TM2 domain-containing protein [Akkermansiaceae bacterium]